MWLYSIPAVSFGVSSTAKVKKDRPYHFGSQGPGDVFSNHGSHSNRLIPFYTFGKKQALVGAMLHGDKETTHAAAPSARDTLGSRAGATPRVVR